MDTCAEERQALASVNFSKNIKEFYTMDINEAIKNRHAVRSYLDKPIPADIISALNAEISECNRESGLNIQLITDEPDAFGGFMAHYGKFSGVKNYIALIGPKAPDTDEKIGYYGERIAIKAQQLGLNTCWVAMSFSKKKSRCTINKGEKLVCVLSLGYGKTQGIAHISKPMEQLCTASGDIPEWFRNGMESAMLAPTAMNQQKFLFSFDGEKVTSRSTGGFYSNVDLGIVKYHFEVGSGKKIFKT